MELNFPYIDLRMIFPPKKWTSNTQMTKFKSKLERRQIEPFFTVRTQMNLTNVICSKHSREKSILNSPWCKAFNTSKDVFSHGDNGAEFSLY